MFSKFIRKILKRPTIKVNIWYISDYIGDLRINLPVSLQVPLSIVGREEKIAFGFDAASKDPINAVGDE